MSFAIGKLDSGKSNPSASNMAYIITEITSTRATFTPIIRPLFKVFSSVSIIDLKKMLPSFMDLTTVKIWKALKINNKIKQRHIIKLSFESVKLLIIA